MKPFIWLVALLVLSFIWTICHTAEYTSVLQLWLMLNVCCPLMWLHLRKEKTPKYLEGSDQKCTNKQRVLSVFCVCRSVRDLWFACES